MWPAAKRHTATPRPRRAACKSCDGADARGLRIAILVLPLSLAVFALHLREEPGPLEAVEDAGIDVILRPAAAAGELRQNVLRAARDGMRSGGDCCLKSL